MSKLFHLKNDYTLGYQYICENVHYININLEEIRAVDFAFEIYILFGCKEQIVKS